LIPKLYATYKAAGEYITKNPEEAAALIAPKSTPEDRAALVSLIKSNERLGMSVLPHGSSCRFTCWDPILVPVERILHPRFPGSQRGTMHRCRRRRQSPAGSSLLPAAFKRSQR
jgi:hypothetical protein